MVVLGLVEVISYMVVLVLFKIMSHIVILRLLKVFLYGCIRVGQSDVTYYCFRFARDVTYDYIRVSQSVFIYGCIRVD